MFVAALIGYLLPTPSVGIVGTVGLVEDAQNTVQQMMDRVETLTGYCRVVQAVLVGSPESKTRAEFQNFLLPAQPVLDYLYSNNQSAPRPRPFITIIQQPQHGNLHRVPDHTDVNGTVFEDVYEYQPKPNYLGPDQFIALIDVSGRRVRMVWNLVAVEHVAEPPYLGESELSKLANDCESSQEIKRSVGGGQLDNNESVRYTGLGSATSGNPYTFNNISVTFASLEGQAVGNTAGVGLTAQITLDKDAAGHGWFIDTTPTTNEEFLPTANPTVWQAKAGTAAGGKMDMLSVLLHEYGHAIGLEHSGAASDFMSAALQPGVRKLPSADEMALMARLVAQLKGERGGDTPPGLPQDQPGHPNSPRNGEQTGQAQIDFHDPRKPAPTNTLRRTCPQ